MDASDISLSRQYHAMLLSVTLSYYTFKGGMLQSAQEYSEV